jgi:hypothetical protein
MTQELLALTLGLRRQARLAAEYAVMIFEIAGALIGAAAVIAIQIRRDRRDRSDSAGSTP